MRLKKVKTEKKSLKDYKKTIDKNEYQAILNYAKKLKNLNVTHFNAVDKGGGVAEMLHTLVPLKNDIGLRANWRIIPPDNDFFQITKKIHNALQGNPKGLTSKEMNYYINYNRKMAEQMEKIKSNRWIIHDPQPAAGLKFFNDNINAVWRCHIDLTNPNQEVWNFIREFLDKYKYYVFSLPDYVAPNIDPDKVCIIHPAIDPLTEKNKPMPEKKAKKIIADHGIDAAKPLICQISRFDPWKDPVGVIKAYKIAKKSFPDLQLALMGLIVAKDDPEAVEMHKKVKKAKTNDPDIHIFADPAKINVSNNQMVNALQTASDIVIQKSIREGFGLTVTEAMWKSKPVIAGNVGGIKIQIDHKISGFLVNNIEETAKYIEKLLENPELGKKMGKAAKDTVRKKFLITRLLLDWLKVLDNIN